MLDDLFGLESELKIRKSKVREIFTPHTPVNEIEHLFGRENDVKRMVSLINSPGQHILIYGDRGVGKTSLAKATCSLILNKISKASLLTKSCDSGDNFSSLFLEPLKLTGHDVYIQSSTKASKQGGDAGLNLGVIKAGIQSEHELTTTFTNTSNLHSPSWLAQQLKDLDCIYLIDEVDTLVNDEDKHKLAELIKALSDLNSCFKIILVGIAKTASELTAGHRSIQRCLKEIHLERMPDNDIKKIVINGMNRIKSKRIPNDEVINKIVDISSGFPYFTHLICLKCAEIAISRNLSHIELNILNEALLEVAKDSESTLSNILNEMLRNTNTPQEYKLILLAASYCQRKDFRNSELSNKLNELFGITINSRTLSARLARLSGSYDNNTILLRTAKGCFTFSDPRMSSFIKILFNTSNRLRLSDAS